MVGYSSINQDISKCRRKRNKESTKTQSDFGMNCERQENNSRAVKKWHQCWPSIAVNFWKPLCRVILHTFCLFPFCLFCPLVRPEITHFKVKASHDTQHVIGTPLYCIDYIETYSAKISPQYCAGEG